MLERNDPRDLVIVLARVTPAWVQLIDESRHLYELIFGTHHRDLARLIEGHNGRTFGLLDTRKELRDAVRCDLGRDRAQWQRDKPAPTNSSRFVCVEQRDQFLNRFDPRRRADHDHSVGAPVGLNAQAPDVHLFNDALLPVLVDDDALHTRADKPLERIDNRIGLRVLEREELVRRIHRLAIINRLDDLRDPFDLSRGLNDDDDVLFGHRRDRAVGIKQRLDLLRNERSACVAERDRHRHDLIGRHTLGQLRLKRLTGSLGRFGQRREIEEVALMSQVPVMPAQRHVEHADARVERVLVR